MEDQQGVLQRAPAAEDRRQTTGGWYTAILHDRTAIEQLVACLQSDDSLELQLRTLDHAIVAVCWRQAQR
jgi:hypothetical protein